MTTPGTEIIERDQPPPRSAPTDSGVWIVAGITEKGPTSPTLVTSLTEKITKFGQRSGGVMLHDAVDTFFREGGAKVIINRVTGPSPVLATHTFNDGSAAAAIAVDAMSFGSWGNGISVQVVAGGVGGTFVLVVTYNGVEVERSPDLVAQPDAIAWAANSNYIRVRSLGSANDPAVVAAQALTGGTDDSGAATDATWKAAIDKAGPDLGPGQVSYPGRTSSQAHADLQAHGAANNRVPFEDLVDTHTVATLVTSALAARAVNGAKTAGAFAPWAEVPGITPGTTRIVPYSAVQAGIVARNDGRGRSPNEPAAGELGQAVYAIGLSQDPWTDAERGQLNDAGVNVAREMFGGVRTYGYRTLVDPVATPQWKSLGNARLYMEIAAKADVVSERFFAAQLDGQRKKISEYGGALTGLLLPYYTDGSLFGETPEEAFNVDVGVQVNTVASISAGELHAVIALRMSPFAERVILEIVKVPTAEAVA